MRKWGLIALVALVALLVAAFGIKLRQSPREPELFYRGRPPSCHRGSTLVYASSAPAPLAPGAEPAASDFWRWYFMAASVREVTCSLA